MNRYQRWADGMADRWEQRVTPPTAQQARDAARRHAHEQRRGVQVVGVVLIAAAAAGYWIPHVIYVGSVSQVRGLCASSAGSFAQALNRQAATDCASAGKWAAGLGLLALAGVLMLVVPALLVRSVTHERDS